MLTFGFWEILGSLRWIPKTLQFAVIYSKMYTGVKLKTKYQEKGLKLQTKVALKERTGKKN